MASNVSVKITAEVVDLQAKYAIASASTRALNSELNSLAKQAAAAGGEMSAELKASLTQVAESTIKAKGEMSALKAEMNAGKESARVMAEGMGMVKEAMGAFGLVASVGAVVEFGKAIFENAADLQRQADALGVSTDQLQAFQYAARASGVETDTATQALTKFYSGLGQAYEGTGPALRALQDLGLNVGRLATDQENASATVARALLAESNQYERNAHIRELFGKSGQDMNAMLEQLALGFDANLDAAKRNGEYISGEQTRAMLEASREFDEAKTKLEVGLTPAVLFLTHSLVGLVDMFQAVARLASSAGSGISSIGTSALIALPGVGQLAMMLDLINLKRTQQHGGMAFEPATPYNARSNAAEKVDVAGLDALDSKLRERKVLLGEIKTATDTLHEAQAAHDKDGEKSAQTVISDLNKQLEALNKVKNTSGFANAGAEAISDAQVKLSTISGDPTKSAQERKAAEDAIYDELLQDARLNAAQINEVTKEKNKADIAAAREAANEKRQIDQSNTQTGLQLAKIDLEQKKSLLEEEVANHTITKQQELAQLKPLIEAELDAELKAINDAEKGYSSESAFFIEKENEKKVVVANSQAQIAAIRRQSAEESSKQESSIYKSMYSELASAEDSFVQGMFSKRGGVLVALENLSRNFIEKEIEDDLHYFTARALLSDQELASEQGKAQAGIVLHGLMESEKTASTTAGTAARTSVEQAGAATENAGFLARAARWVASELGMTTATTTAEATRTAAKATAAATAKAEEAAANVASAESYAGVAAAAAAAAVAGIPIVGPELAVAAAASTFAALQPYASLAALDVGAYNVPHDMPAYIHQGEMVVPKTFASGLRDSIGSGVNVFGGDTNTSSRGGDRYHLEQHFHEQRSPSQSARDMADSINHLRRIGRLKG